MKIGDSIQVTPGQLPRVPQRRRCLPPPFERPSLTIGKHGKVWRRIPVLQVPEGATVPDVGVIKCVVSHVRHVAMADLPFVDPSEPDIDPFKLVAVGEDVVLIGVMGVEKTFDSNDSVMAFVDESYCF